VVCCCCCCCWRTNILHNQSIEKKREIERDRQTSVVCGEWSHHIIIKIFILNKNPKYKYIFLLYFHLFQFQFFLFQLHFFLISTKYKYTINKNHLQLSLFIHNTFYFKTKKYRQRQTSGVWRVWRVQPPLHFSTQKPNIKYNYIYLFNKLTCFISIAQRNREREKERQRETDKRVLCVEWWVPTSTTSICTYNTSKNIVQILLLILMHLQFHLLSQLQYHLHINVDNHHLRLWHSIHHLSWLCHYYMLDEITSPVAVGPLTLVRIPHDVVSQTKLSASILIIASVFAVLWVPSNWIPNDVLVHSNVFPAYKWNHWWWLTSFYYYTISQSNILCIVNALNEAGNPSASFGIQFHHLLQLLLIQHHHQINKLHSQEVKYRVLIH